MGFDTLDVDRGAVDEWFQCWGDLADHSVLDRLLVGEFGNAGPESKDPDDVHLPVGLDESSWPIFAVLVEQPVLTHNQLSSPGWVDEKPYRRAAPPVIGFGLTLILG